MIQWPSLLGGSHKLVSWLNKLMRCARASEIKQVIGNGRLIENSDGKILEIGTFGGNGVAHPFRIYKGTTWLNAKVATGHILTTGDIITPSNVDINLTLVTATAKNWIYVDLTSTTATFAASATLPTWAVDKIPIGYVDTTNTSAELQVITQIRKEHIFDPCL
jgi:hypothetical protein